MGRSTQTAPAIHVINISMGCFTFGVRSHFDADSHLRRDLPAKGMGAALVVPFWNTAAMNQHLAEIGQTVEPGRHAALPHDRPDGTYPVTSRCPIASRCYSCSITLLQLLAKCPALNVWRIPSSSRAITGCPTGSFVTTTISRGIAATIGTVWSISLGTSCPPACAIRRIGTIPWELA